MKANSVAVSRTESRKDPAQDRFASRAGDIFKDGPKRNFMLRLDLAKPEPIAEARKVKLNGTSASKAMQSGNCRLKRIVKKNGRESSCLASSRPATKEVAVYRERP
eukprot:TRINITY_DN2610_c0_g1_i12.p1 TRINITY_DN2610_c0_g1~~TRINITY_DN2610_c0_g1_i12.p1  ORF type:complete len:106 (+),score=20.88 TRINITY_DN2610_c0_g1_i12:240-557(+)